MKQSTCLVILIAMETILAENYVLPQLPKYYIIKWAVTVLIQRVHHCVIYQWKAESFSIRIRCCGIVINYVVYIYIIIHILTVNIQIITAHVQTVYRLFSTHKESMYLPLQHVYYPYPVRTSSIMSMSSQYTIFPDNIQNKSLLLISRQSTLYISYTCQTTPASVQSVLVYHITCPCPVCRPSILPISSQFTNPPTN